MEEPKEDFLKVKKESPDLQSNEHQDKQPDEHRIEQSIEQPGEAEGDKRTSGSTEPRSFVHARSFEGWIDEAVEVHSRKGGFKDLPGAGKPLTIDNDDDLYTRAVKNAGYIPPWLEQRKRIALRIKELLDRGETEDGQKLEELNQWIRLYNRSVPNPLLQKGLVTAENLAGKYEQWI